MNFKGLLNSKWPMIILSISWIVTAALGLYMLNTLDMIVHGTLYDFGLQFSNLWADPYWTYLNLIYASLGVSSSLAFFAMMIGFYRSNMVVSQSVKVPEKIEEAKIEKKPKMIVKQPVSKPKVVKANASNMVISCPNCKKVFSRPMVMLNFEEGKTRLVNVCPYCNYGLGQKEENKKANPEFQIRGQDEAESDHRVENSY